MKTLRTQPLKAGYRPSPYCMGRSFKEENGRGIHRHPPKALWIQGMVRLPSSSLELIPPHFPAASLTISA